MRTALLTRTQSGDEGTFGKLVTDSGRSFRTGELPWRDNEVGRSCIPAGTYQVVWALSPTKGWVYHVIKVPGRTDIEIHSGNFCGDEALGYRSDVKGCLLLGKGIGEKNGQQAVLFSHQAFSEFYETLREAQFTLKIVAAY